MALTWYERKVKTSQGFICDLRQEIPYFKQVPFRVGDGVNEHLELIVREPLISESSDAKAQIPIASVSKQYRLVQHHDVLDALEAAMKHLNFEPRCLNGELTLTEYGEYMRVSYFLPGYDFDPGDGCSLVLKVNALNAVDKTAAPRIYLSWYRLICGNSMPYGVDASLRKICLKSRTSQGVAAFLSAHLDGISAEKTLYSRWYQTKHRADWIKHWVDGAIAKRWGIHAAARVQHIAKTGYDGEVVTRHGEPHEREVRSSQLVPGSFAPVRNVYHLYQVVCWMASQREKVQEQIEWLLEIPVLMDGLRHPRKAGSAKGLIHIHDDFYKELELREVEI